MQILDSCHNGFSFEIFCFLKMTPCMYLLYDLRFGSNNIGMRRSLLLSNQIRLGIWTTLPPSISIKPIQLKYIFYYLKLPAFEVKVELN